MRYAMIMAGGAGTRLWPMSRRDRPKQLLAFIGTPGGPMKSLLELAADRLDGLIEPKNRYICTAERYRDTIKRELALFSDKKADDRILGEPAARDTVNAVGFAAAVLLSIDKNAVFAVLTADHIIEPLTTFRERMDLGFRLVEDDPRRLVTFSIKPTYAATGFGYVERGSPIRNIKGPEGSKGAAAYHVERFVEKPDLPRAQAYLESGSFGWNSGMFVWKASTFLDALKKYKPENHAGLLKVGAAWGTKKQRAVLDEVYPELPKTSVDYAVMEPASRERSKDFSVCTVPMDVRWLDVGSWPSFAETLAADAQGNRVSGTGPVVSVRNERTLAVNAAPGHTLAILGCEDLIVVHTPDATLVMPRARAEELKDLHGALDERLR